MRTLCFVSMISTSDVSPQCRGKPWLLRTRAWLGMVNSGQHRIVARNPKVLLASCWVCHDYWMYVRYEYMHPSCDRHMLRKLPTSSLHIILCMLDCRSQSLHSRSFGLAEAKAEAPRRNEIEWEMVLVWRIKLLYRIVGVHCYWKRAYTRTLGQCFEALAGCLQKWCPQPGFVSVARSTSHQEAFREMPLQGLLGLVKYIKSVGFVGLLEPVKARNEGTVTKTNAQAKCSLRW